MNSKLHIADEAAAEIGGFSWRINVDEGQSESVGQQSHNNNFFVWQSVQSTFIAFKKEKQSMTITNLEQTQYRFKETIRQS